MQKLIGKMMAMLIMALILLSSSWAVAGNLGSPSGPAPTMKTLDQAPPSCIIMKEPECTYQPPPLQLLFTTKRFEVLADFNCEAVLDEETRLIWTWLDAAVR